MLHVIANEVAPFDRGRATGEALADRLARVWASYASLFVRRAGIPEPDALAFGAATLELVRGWRPAVAEEMEGVAVGGGLEPNAVAALNARTELLAGAVVECSTVGRVRGPEGPWLSQNWDWFLDVPERCVIVTGPSHVTFTEAGILAKIGVNGAGLALCVDILRHPSDTRRPTATPIHLLLHQVLATCETIEDVAGLLEEADPVASSCFTVVTSAGHGASFEVTADGVARVDPDDDGLLHHTNHFLDPRLASEECLGGALAKRCNRDAALTRDRPATVSQGRAALSDHDARPDPVCRHAEPGVRGLPETGTAAYVAMDLVTRTMEAGAGPTCAAVTETLRSPVCALVTEGD